MRDAIEIVIKDDFQSVLRTLKFVCIFCFATYRKYITTTAIMDAKRSKLYALFFLISLNETTSQLQKSMKLLEKEFERFVTNNIDSHSIEWELIMFINIREYGLEIIFT